jgi:acyl-CoA thioesterase
MSQARAMMAADEASRALGMELREAGPGRAVVTMRLTDLMINGHGVAHGGYLFLLADTAFACACNSHGGGITVASGAEITFVGPGRSGDELVAEATERTRYGRNGIYDVTVYVERDGDRAVLAEFRGRSRTLATDQSL